MANKTSLFLVLTAMMLQFTFSYQVTAQEQVSKVVDDVYRYGDPNLGYFSMFIITNDGVIVIDPMNTTHSQGLLKAIQKITKQPIRYLLHSHNHWDHAKGGQIFREQGAKIAAHKEAAQWMQKNPHGDLVMPDEIWSGKRKEIELGDKKIELHYLGINHGLGMTAFLLPKEKVAYIADIVTPKRMPFSIADFNIKELMRTLDELEQLDFTKAVFSHSYAKEAVGGKSDLADTKTFFIDLQQAIFAEFKKGTTFYQMPNTLKLPQYQQWAFYNEWLPINTWNMMFQVEMGSFPWRVESNSIEEKSKQ
ncbi:MBL fold metallo-hydrolase [Shewanella woodyi]|uniref:Beta-lactamase domain protein n=1 Tax=Shewanella woodyi (strain ATCC 51908 / MS32) TaxID=392500 RepID=B1KJU1_SHEWM|nr:MBL fold metallo-hydrolase [Shewanella woodyi]ACA87128.1 beta-lactamase domain protein [Shewanella woodyi ATCC 51908]